MILRGIDRSGLEAMHAVSTDPERELAEAVCACARGFEQGIGKDARERFDRFYSQYRGFRRFRDAWTKAGPSDKDGMLYDAKKHWGAHLHIPLSFRTIEHMVPKSIAHRPKLLYLPRQERWQHNVQTIQLLIDAQQENIDIDLPFQAVMRSGRIYGIGFGKTLWRKEYVMRRRTKRRMWRPDSFVTGRQERYCTFDDPTFEDVDPYDAMWDPYGADLLSTSSRRCGWFIHRIWLGLDDCLERIESGAWATDSVKALVEKGRVEEDLRAMGSASKFDEIWADRMLASGLPSFTTAQRGEHPHELLEWHDGERVISVLDRQLLVQDGENPACGTLPFGAYRPTPLQGQMLGIGDMEPLEHLQRELDTQRSQAMDAVTIALCAGFVYDENAIDQEDLVFGPAAAIPSRNARVGDALQPLPRPEIPASAFRVHELNRQDFEAVAGINEALDPATGVTQTATQAQLVQASLSARIALGSRRFELEIVRQAARCFLFLNQRMILQNRGAVRVPDEGLDMAQAAQEGRWRWVDVGPGELQGEFEIIPEGGSMAARNIPQDRQDAQMFFAMAQGNPHIEPRRAILKGLELCGIKDPESWLKQTDPPIPPMALDLLQQAGVNPLLIRQAVEVAQRNDPRLADPDAAQGPNVQQVDQAMTGPPEMVAA